MPFLYITNPLFFIAQSDDQTLSSPILLHLAHPFTLQNFITALKHVKEFRGFLGSLPAGGENSQIAKEVLVDLVDCSGIDLTGLISALEEVLERVQSLDRELNIFCLSTSLLQSFLSATMSKSTCCMSANSCDATWFDSKHSNDNTVSHDTQQSYPIHKTIWISGWRIPSLHWKPTEGNREWCC